jgi:hypothetical protein
MVPEPCFRLLTPVQLLQQLFVFSSGFLFSPAYRADFTPGRTSNASCFQTRSPSLKQFLPVNWYMVLDFSEAFSSRLGWGSGISISIRLL